jgi:hypothetical protein
MAAEKWRVNGQNVKVVDFNYWGVTLEGTGGWIKENILAKAKEYQAVAAVDKYI